MAKKNTPARGSSKHGGWGGNRPSKGGGLSITRSGNKSGTSGGGKKSGNKSSTSSGSKKK